MPERLILGTRSTPLAMAELQEFLSDVDGSCFLTSFHPTRAVLQEALVRRNIDLCLGSDKDFRGVDERISRIAVSESPDSTNALVSKGATSFLRLPQHAKVGVASDSLRVSLQQYRSDLDVQVLRGSVDERLRRVLNSAGEVGAQDSLNAVVIASIALKRLGLAFLISEILSPDFAPSSQEQGRIALCALKERREVKTAIREILLDKTNWRILE